MKQFNWQPDIPFEAISFDCDGTMSQIEGIDILADKTNVGEEVRRLTKQAMSETGITSELYATRMALVKPNRSQLIELGKEYYTKHVTDIVEVIQTFHSLGKEVFVISAGLNPSVKLFASLLGISEENVFAVDVKFDEDGNYVDYDHGAPTARQAGKSDIISRLHLKYSSVAHVGDGMNDYEASQEIDRFIGYGGASYREKIAENSNFYIKSVSIAPMLPLCLTDQEVQRIPAQLKATYQAGFDLIDRGEVSIKETLEKNKINQ